MIKYIKGNYNDKLDHNTQSGSCVDILYFLYQLMDEPPYSDPERNNSGIIIHIQSNSDVSMVLIRIVNIITKL